jgi:hypothetical protein
MADFCNKCATELFGTKRGPEININEIYQVLNPEEYQIVLCEGCGLTAVGKTQEETMVLAIPCEDEESNDPTMQCVRWITQEEYENLPSKI